MTLTFKKGPGNCYSVQDLGTKMLSKFFGIWQPNSHIFKNPSVRFHREQIDFFLES